MVIDFSLLQPWEDNPRDATDADIERLKKQIQELGAYKPLICVKDKKKYIVIGGNMRYRVYQMLKHKKAWIVVVDAKTKAQRLKYALSDNDRIGYYKDAQLVELMRSIDVDFKSFAHFKIDTTLPELSVDALIDDTNYDDLDNELKKNKKFTEVKLTIVVPKEHEEAVKKFLANGHDTNPVGMGKGVLKLCGLL